MTKVINSPQFKNKYYYLCIYKLIKKYNSKILLGL